MLIKLFKGNIKLGLVNTIENGENIKKFYYVQGTDKRNRYHLLNASAEQYDKWQNKPKEKITNMIMNGRQMGGSPLQVETKSRNSKSKASTQQQPRVIIKPPRK